MELKRIARRSSKAQLMSVIMLIFFLLMVAELFELAQLNITSNNMVQSLTVSFASSNYGTVLKLSANNFAKESLNKAILTLVNYTYTPSLRKGNFIPNMSFYASNLMIGGILPNDTSPLPNYPQNAMGNLTFASYNKSIISLLSFASQSVAVNETRPMIFQTDPYHIRVFYIERLSINASGNNYVYNIPVNVSLPLNNTPDLFYAQQGILKTMKFANLTNITSIVGSVSATSGNTLAYAYGTIYTVPNTATNGAACPLTAGKFSIPPLSKSLIIVTYNAINLGAGSCIDNYAGLISYKAPSTLPANVPYLIYASSSNALLSMPNGTKVLLYGPGLDTLNIENLRSAITNHYYFASPFAPSYIDRANTQFMKQSPNGILTFSNYDTQAASFNGINGNIIVANSNPLDASTQYTVVSWVKTTSASGIIFSGWSGGNGYQVWVNTGDAAVWTGGSGSTLTSSKIVDDGNWHQIAAVFQPTYRAIYVDGVIVGNSILSNNLANAGNNQIGAQCGPSCSLYFTGQIANLQAYNTILTGSQIQQLYQEGIGSVPLSSNALAAWYPLNGNANDYSGNGNNGVQTAMAYILLPNYQRDSLLSYTIPTTLSPLPGILSCTSSATCVSSSTLPELYLGYMPLEAQSGYMQDANFNGQSSYINVGAGFPIGSTVTISAWINSPVVSGGQQAFISNRQGGGNVYLGTVSSSIFIYDNAGSPAGATSNAVLSNNVWVNVVWTSNGVTSRFYVNGVPQGTVAQTRSSSTGTAYIGYDTSTANWWNGAIANLQIYSAALLSPQVQQLYQEGIAGMPFTANLVAWWPLNGNANDYSGNSNNGIASKVVYPYFAGTYNAPGMSTISTPANEWQTFGLANT